MILEDRLCLRQTGCNIAHPKLFFIPIQNSPISSRTNSVQPSSTSFQPYTPLHGIKTISPFRSSVTQGITDTPPFRATQRPCRLP